MATKLNDNLQLKSTKPNFTREQYKTKESMLSEDKRGLSNGLIAYCIEDKTHYKFERSEGQSPTEGEWSVLIDNNTELEEKVIKSSNYLSKMNSSIKMKYRDHDDIANGSLNFVSPLLRYFGWYVPEVMHGSTKVDDTAGSKRFYSPSLYRWIGDSSLSIETITDADGVAGKEGSRRVEAYTTEFNSVDTKLLSSGFTWTHELSGEERTVPTNSVSSFNNMKVLSTGLYHPNIEGINLNKNQEVDIVGMYINWGLVPDGGYIRIQVAKHKTSANTFRLLVKNTNSSTAKVDNFMFKGFADDIKTLDQYNEEDNYFYYEGMGSNIKIEKPESEKGTLILLESRGNGSANDTMQGLVFNIYFPEAYYQECTKGINQNEFTYIQDIKSLGKAANAIAQFNEYSYLPSYPKNGDILKVFDSMDVRGDITFKEFICIYDYAYPESQIDANFLNTSKDKHPNTLRYSFPIGSYVNPVFLEYYLGQNRKVNNYVTRFKEISTNGTSSGSSGQTYEKATSEADGLMSKEDKSKLDGLRKFYEFITYEEYLSMDEEGTLDSETVYFIREV